MWWPRASSAIDSRQAANLLRFIEGLPESSSTVRFFDRKDFYTLLGNDAVFAAREFFRTNAVLKQISAAGLSSVSSCVLTHKNFTSFLREVLLERADRTVEVYEVCLALFEKTVDICRFCLLTYNAFDGTAKRRRLEAKEICITRGSARI